MVGEKLVPKYLRAGKLHVVTAFSVAGAKVFDDAPDSRAGKLKAVSEDIKFGAKEEAYFRFGAVSDVIELEFPGPNDPLHTTRSGNEMVVIDDPLPIEVVPQDLRP